MRAVHPRTTLTQQEEHLFKVLSSERFLKMEGLGNEVAHFIYDYDPAWVIDADWQVLAQPLVIEVPNLAGDLKPVAVTHQAVFEVAGERVTLLPMSVSEQEVFFVFRDRSSGRETYGAGRFLKAVPPVGGRIRLDFNFAFNPPCAFTAFATCPLPPPENWLPFTVPAGERKWLAGG